MQVFIKYMLLAGLAFTIACTDVQAQPKIGEQAPDIAIADAQGKTVKLSSLKGKLVLIDFWASWCGPCRAAMPSLRNVYAAYKAKGFEIYGISLDQKKTDWKKAVAADKTTWIHVNEPGGWETPTARKWNIEKLPSSFLLDKEGKIIAVDLTEKQLQDTLQKLLP
jgi:thiol-disulfide isomerase/thioredoxin